MHNGLNRTAAGQRAAISLDRANKVNLGRGGFAKSGWGRMGGAGGGGTPLY